jgi:hypothetical protein
MSGMVFWVFGFLVEIGIFLIAMFMIWWAARCFHKFSK